MALPSAHGRSEDGNGSEGQETELSNCLPTKLWPRSGPLARPLVIVIANASADVNSCIVLYYRIAVRCVAFRCIVCVYEFSLERVEVDPNAHGPQEN